MRPNFTGSSPLVNTIGMDTVAALAASAAGGEKAASTFTCRRTKSAANRRHPIVVACPPAVFDLQVGTFDKARFVQAERKRSDQVRKRFGRRGIIRIRLPASRGCCARAASGHAAAPPSRADELPPPHAGHGAPSQVPPPIIAGGTAGRRRFDASGACRGGSAGPWGGPELVLKSSSRLARLARHPLPHESPLTGVPYWSAIRSGFMGLWRTRCAFNCAVTATSTSANRVCK